MPACRGASLGSHSASTIKGSCWGFPIPTWACRRAKETPRFLARGSGSPRKDTPPPCVPAKPGLPAGPEPGGVGEGSPGPGCVCACVPVWAWRGCRRCTDPVPHPHTDAVSPKFPRRKPPDAAKCCWPVVSLAGGSQSRGPPSPQGLCTCVRVAAAVCVPYSKTYYGSPLPMRCGSPTSLKGLPFLLPALPPINAPPAASSHPGAGTVYPQALQLSSSGFTTNDLCLLKSYSVFKVASS